MKGRALLRGLFTVAACFVMHAQNASANNNAGAIQGPVRVGIYATANSGRDTAGATYWGVMEMSGNLWGRLAP